MDMDLSVTDELLDNAIGNMVTGSSGNDSLLGTFDADGEPKLPFGGKHCRH